MAKIPAEVQKLFNETPVMVFATATTDGVPNAVPIAIKKIIDDETVLVSDQFFGKTLANLKANDKVSLVFWSDGGSYQIKGSMRYVNEGPEFEAEAEWINAYFAGKNMPVKSKGVCFISVTDVYNCTGGPNAGDKIA